MSAKRSRAHVDEPTEEGTNKKTKAGEDTNTSQCWLGHKTSEWTSPAAPSLKSHEMQAPSQEETNHPFQSNGPFLTTAKKAADDSPMMSSQTNSASTVITVESEQTLDVRGQLSQCLDGLELSKKVQKPFFDNNGSGVGSDFASKLDEVQGFVHGAIQSEGMHGAVLGRPPLLYVCGVPGVGKTTGVLWCCKDAINDFMAHKLSIDEVSPTMCHINAAHLNSAINPLKTIRGQLTKSLGTKSKTLEAGLKNEKNMVVVVVDEIENLISSFSRESPPATEVENALHQLISWAKSDEIHLALIGISNSQSDKKFSRLQMMEEFDVLTFGAYSANDLTGILKSRLVPNTVDDKAIEYISKTVASSGGDARKALELASKAVKTCYEGLSEKSALTPPKPGPWVTMKHVVSAARAQTKQMNETINSLPEDGKALLCVLAALSKTDVTRTTFGALRRFVSDCMEFRGGYDLTPVADFRCMLETLENSALIQLGDANGIKSDLSVGELMYTPVVVGAQMADIEKAVVAELGKEGFYATVMDKARKNLDKFRPKTSSM